MDGAAIWIILGAIAIFAIYVLVLYNILVRLVNHCDESWSNIDTELKRRYDLIPNLVETVKGYAKHEQETLDLVIQARNQAMAQKGSPNAQAGDENKLVGTLKHLFAIAESYPDLKANSNFLHLQKELVNTEDRIQRSRRFYNGNVRDLNTRVSVFPTNILAGIFGFQKREFFEIDDASIREPVKVSL